MYIYIYKAVCQNLVPLVNIKIAGTWMFIPLKMVCIGIDPYPYMYIPICYIPLVIFPAPFLAIHQKAPGDKGKSWATWAWASRCVRASEIDGFYGFGPRKMEVFMGKPWENHRKMEVYPLVNIEKAIENGDL